MAKRKMIMKISENNNIEAKYRRKRNNGEISMSENNNGNIKRNISNGIENNDNMAI
jgi:hypothetical protein